MQTEQAGTLRKTFVDYDSRLRPKSARSCCKCQRDIRPGHPCRWVRLVDGGHMVLHPDDAGAYVAEAGDCGWHPIGDDCARMIGFEWSVADRPA